MTYGDAMLQLLAERATAGATAAEIKAHTRGTMQCYITRYTAAGIIGWADEPAKRPRGLQSLRRYWLREHCPAGASLQPKRELRKIKPKPVPAAIPAQPNGNTVKLRPPLTASDEFRAAEPLVTERTRVTICPSGKDQRFTPDQVTPFFAAGKWLPPSPWAAAVAGGAAA